MKSKLPAIQFYIGDWLKDPKLSMCSPSTRGIWMDLLCAMHELDRSGLITGTTEQLARLCRCTAVEMSAAIAELRDTKAGDVTERNGNVTVINRRMLREAKEREDNNNRVRKHRGNAPVTEVKRESNTASSSSSSIAVTAADSNNKSAAAAVSVNGCKSKFSMEQCRRFTEYLVNSGRNFTNPEGFAISIFQNATADAEIKTWIDEGERSKPKRKAQIPG